MPSDYERRRHLRELDRLLQRVLQLDELLCRDAVLDDERAAHIKEQIRRSQCKLDHVYEKLDFANPDA